MTRREPADDAQAPAYGFGLLAAGREVDDTLLTGGPCEATEVAGEVNALLEFLFARISDDMAGTATMVHRPTAARILDECRAKWQIAEQAAAWQRGIGGRQTKDALEIVVRRLAKVYANHPDYRDEWKP